MTLETCNLYRLILEKGANIFTSKTPSTMLKKLDLSSFKKTSAFAFLLSIIIAITVSFRRPNARRIFLYLSSLYGIYKKFTKCSLEIFCTCFFDDSTNSQNLKSRGSIFPKTIPIFHIYIYIYVCVCVYVWMIVYIYIYIYIHIYIFNHSLTHTHVLGWERKRAKEWETERERERQTDRQTDMACMCVWKRGWVFLRYNHLFLLI